MDIKDKSYYGHTRPEMLKYIPKNAKRILEIGCGQANFSFQLSKEDVEIWGVEPDVNAANVASKRLFKVLTGTLDDTINNLPDNYFDVIIMNDVLEHLLYPWEDLKNLKQKLSDNGVTVSSIPNVRYSKNIFKMIFKKDWKYTESGILDNTHFRFFTKKSIKRMHNECGLSIQKIQGVNMTKSFLYFPYALVVNILMLFTQLDMFYMQFATVAKKKD